MQSSVPNGFLNSSTPWGDYNQIHFVIQQLIAKVQTVMVVRVVSCTNDGGLSPVGYVDVVPMVHQIDSAGLSTPHTTIFNVPYLRLQGGTNAIIIDPQPGDIGMCGFCSRDISKVKSTKEANPPGSARLYDYADGLYLGGFLNAQPVQFLQFNGSGITITSPTAVTINAPAVAVNATTATVTAPTTNIIGNTTITGNTVINGALAVNTGGAGATLSGNFTLTGSMIASGDVSAQGTSLHTHLHSGVTTGGGNTGAPV